MLAAAFAAWISTVLAASVCAAELAVSGTNPWSVCFPAMAGVHVVVGFGEAIATALVLVAIAQRPELLEPTTVLAPARPYRTIAAYGAVIALGLAFFIAPLLELPDMPDSLDKMKDQRAAQAKFLEDNALKDRVVFIQFGQVGSEACGKGLEGMIALDQKKVLPGLKMVGVEAGKDAKAVDEYVTRYKPPFPVVCDTNGTSPQHSTPRRPRGTCSSASSGTSASTRTSCHRRRN